MAAIFAHTFNPALRGCRNRLAPLLAVPSVSQYFPALNLGSQVSFPFALLRSAGPCGCRAWHSLAQNG